VIPECYLFSFFNASMKKIISHFKKVSGQGKMVLIFGLLHGWHGSFLREKRFRVK